MAKLILLILLSVNGCFALLNHYLKMAKTDAIGHNIASFPCGEGESIYFLYLCNSRLFISLGFAKECDIEVLAAACNANPACQGFNTNGLLKSCTAGCHAHCCYDVTDKVDLYIRKGYLPPNDWQDDVDHGKILFANPEPNFCFLPEIANGYIGTVAMSASLFQSGLFNGKVERKKRNFGIRMRLFYSSVEVLERRDYHHLLVVRLQQENLLPVVCNLKKDYLHAVINLMIRIEPLSNNELLLVEM
jgi:hypothetical protein